MFYLLLIERDPLIGKLKYVGTVSLSLNIFMHEGQKAQVNIPALYDLKSSNIESPYTHTACFHLRSCIFCKRL